MAGAGSVRLLTFSTLYPNAAQPNHGVFVENRLRQLLAYGGASSRVMAPVAYFPAALARLGAPRRWSDLAGVPPREIRYGITVEHPRFLVVPRLGMSAAPMLLHRAAAACLRRLEAAGLGYDVIDAHYVYPDGVAALRLAGGKWPVVITARGSDVTQLPDFSLPRRWIEWAVRRADGLIAVSAALAERLVALGARPDRVRVLRNGVDLAGFQPPADRPAARRALGLGDRPALLSVGHLIERKGHDRSIAALAALPEAVLLIAGDGPLRARLEALAAQHGVADRVRFLGSRPHAELPALYGAADALVLASSREGWANVLLEAMACGTPVVASPIPGNDEVVREPAAGLIAPANTPAGIAEAVRRLLDAPPNRAATRAYAERHGWEETSAGQLAVFHRALTGR
jgi:glycosyltransferase involved in cell wall biosynthesis